MEYVGQFGLAICSFVRVTEDTDIDLKNYYELDKMIKYNDERDGLVLR